MVTELPRRLPEGYDLGMGRGIRIADLPVRAASDHPAVMHDDGADRNLEASSASRASTRASRMNRSLSPGKSVPAGALSEPVLKVGQHHCLHLRRIDVARL